jgi:zinc transport system ATP-binding protein
MSGKRTEGRTTIIEMKGVAFSYDGHDVLSNVNFTLSDREFAGMVGPNGGGKTTLLKLMLGLLAPTAGTITMLGSSPVDARPRIGYMPQHAQIDPSFPAPVLDIVMTGRLSGGRVRRYSSEDRERAEIALSEVGLSDRRASMFSSLSGGLRQRTLIARALVSDPELLLLDEPTANLDVRMETQLHELLRKLNERMAIVLVSHDVGFVSEYATRVICVKETVVLHPTSELSGDTLREMYGEKIRIVRHDHDEDGRVTGDYRG